MGYRVHNLCNARWCRLFPLKLRICSIELIQICVCVVEGGEYGRQGQGAGACKQGLQWLTVQPRGVGANTSMETHLPNMEPGTKHSAPSSTVHQRPGTLYVLSTGSPACPHLLCPHVHGWLPAIHHGARPHHPGSRVHLCHTGVRNKGGSVGGPNTASRQDGDLPNDSHQAGGRGGGGKGYHAGSGQGTHPRAWIGVGDPSQS
jgi:hypothetical protein